MIRLLALCVFSLATMVALPAVAQSSPHQIVQDSTDKILAAMAIETNQKEQAISTALEGILGPLVDFDGIARAVMGKHYKTATPEQQQRFARVLRQTMLTLYTKVLVNFEISRVIVKEPLPSEPFSGKVYMDVTAADGTLYSIAYSMRQNGEGTWKIRNVILDGINLGLTYRSQFDSAANHHEGDIDRVIDGWENDRITKTAENQQGS